MDKEDFSHKQVAIQIADLASADEREVLRSWVQSSLNIVSSDISSLAKLKSVIKITASNKVLWPTIKVISRAIKRYGWDNRSAKMRRFYAAGALTLATVGGQSAGIAALGGAIAVPLWVVFGAGAAFLPVLYRALIEKEDQLPPLKTTYTVINAEKHEG